MSSPRPTPVSQLSGLLGSTSDAMARPILAAATPCDVDRAVALLRVSHPASARESSHHAGNDPRRVAPPPIGAASRLMHGLGGGIALQGFSDLSQADRDGQQGQRLHGIIVSRLEVLCHLGRTSRVLLCAVDLKVAHAIRLDVTRYLRHLCTC